MSKVRATTAFRSFLALMLATLLAFPAPAFAAQEDVRVTECATSQNASTSVTKITIGDVRAPQAGSALDDTATVSTAEGLSWEIPVLWIDSDLQLATMATEGQGYLPALAFFLPNDYTVGDADATGAFTIAFSPELANLFGNENVVSVYNAATGITYILPASLRNFFTPAASAATQETPAAPTTTAEQDVVPQTTTETKKVDLVDLYCSQTAKEVLSREELEYLVDLILNKLEPQAVNLLREKFPAFAEAAEKGEIGTRIGLYIYYDRGDLDGIEEHEGASPNALAYVYGSPKIIDGSMKYTYILAVNAEGVCDIDLDGNVTIARTGKKATDLQNTLVHEMLHAYMDDYNRAGMAGAISVDTMVEDPSVLKGDALTNFLSIRYPLWFIEGTASAVENVYQYRNSTFKALYAATPSLNFAAGTEQAIYYNYLTATRDGVLIGFRLPFAAGGGTDANGNKVSTDASRYVSGYLATLYLSNMQAKSSGTGSAVTTQNGKTTVSSDVLRSGYNTILKRMHDGETLDQIIADISKDSSGTSLYASTDDFAEKFICGPNTSMGYTGDNASLAFVTQFLNYMEAIDADTSRANGANGSILFDLDRDFAGPLDSTKNETSDLYKIVESNQSVESSVPNSTAIATGGKSQSGATGTTAEAEAVSSEAVASTTGALTSAAEETVEKTQTTTTAEEAAANETVSATVTETTVATAAEANETTTEELPLAAKATEETTETE